MGETRQELPLRSILARVGPLLERAHLQMKEWDHEGEGPSIALKVEATVLALSWAAGLFAAVSALVGFR